MMKVDLCSFCQKRRDEVMSLISGPEVFICSLCVDACDEAMSTGQSIASMALIPEQKPYLDVECSFCSKKRTYVRHLVQGPVETSGHGVGIFQNLFK
jgi:hypothetical protein